MVLRDLHAFSRDFKGDPGESRDKVRAGNLDFQEFQRTTGNENVGDSLKGCGPQASGKYFILL